MSRQVVYDIVYEIKIESTGVSSNPDVVHVGTPEEAGAAVAAALKRARSWQWVTVREREVRVGGGAKEAVEA